MGGRQRARGSQRSQRGQGAVFRTQEMRADQAKVELGLVGGWLEGTGAAGEEGRKAHGAGT